MRVLAVGGVAVIVMAAVLVPLPWTVVHPEVFVPAADLVSIQIQPGPVRGQDLAVSGEYLVVRQRRGAPFAWLLAALLDPGARVVRPGREPAGAVDPVVAATMAGLGIVPRHADPSQLPVTAEVRGVADPHALGLALHAFDVGSTIDVARGRRILGLGRAEDGGALACAGPVSVALRAAAADIDVVVVPADCAAGATDALPPGAAVRVVEASLLGEAAQALAK